MGTPMKSETVYYYNYRITVTNKEVDYIAEGDNDSKARGKHTI